MRLVFQPSCIARTVSRLQSPSNYGSNPPCLSGRRFTHTTTGHTGRKSVRLTLIGPPGSGKGTQSSKLEQDFGLSSISTGQILRKFAEQNTEAGKRIRDILASGGLVEDETMLEIIKGAIAKETNGWIIDGYPRNPAQAGQLDTLLKEIHQPLSVVFYLDVPEEVLLERLQERWVHPASGRTYNLTFSPPKVAGVDDITGEPLVRRSDDNPNSIRKRLQTYHEATEPLIEYYKRTGLLFSIRSPTSAIGYVKIKNIMGALLSSHSSPSSSSSPSSPSSSPSPSPS